MAEYEVRWTDHGTELSLGMDWPDSDNEQTGLNVLRAIRDELFKEYPDARIVRKTENEEVIE